MSCLSFTASIREVVNILVIIKAISRTTWRKISAHHTNGKKVNIPWRSVKIPNTVDACRFPYCPEICCLDALYYFAPHNKPRSRAAKYFSQLRFSGCRQRIV
jgi:hypothetical protein